MLLLAWPAYSPAGDPIDEARARGAVANSLPLLQAAARQSAEKRRCFTCHNEGLPVLVFETARQRGFEIESTLIRDLAEHTRAHLARGKSHYLKGIGQGGKIDTAGFALWTLQTAEFPRDELTDAVIGFLLQWNGDTPYWTAQSRRPPSEGSRFTSTFFALRGFDAFPDPSKAEAIERRRSAARRWLLETRPETTEDFVFRLQALALARVEKPVLAKATRDLLALQREEGGWGQLPELDSDAYATGSALVALRTGGRVNPNSSTYRRGLRFLLDSQEEDGSWHVVSRSPPLQEPYETGFPHGKDQFISSSGTAWATLAILESIPE